MPDMNVSALEQLSSLSKACLEVMCPEKSHLEIMAVTPYEERQTHCFPVLQISNGKKTNLTQACVRGQVLEVDFAVSLVFTIIITISPWYKAS